MVFDLDMIKAVYKALPGRSTLTCMKSKALRISGGVSRT